MLLEVTVGYTMRMGSAQWFINVWNNRIESTLKQIMPMNGQTW